MGRRALAAVVLSALAATAGCGAAAPGRTPTSAARCARTDAAELRAIAQRIYAQAAQGRNVVAARRRLARSARLADAVAAGSPARTAAALRPLLRHQITRIAIWSPDGRPLARYGTSAAPAPVSGTITDPLGLPVGRYVLSVSSDAALAGEMAAVTGATARVGASPPASAPPSAPPGATATTVAFAGTAYPQGPLTVSLALPPALVRPCGPTPGATRMAVVAAVGRRLLDSERAGPQARRVLRHVATDRGFRAAVAARDPAALRAAIIRFFRTRSLHVVRIRATDARGRLIGDVGGPFVLSPISGAVHAGRRGTGPRIGRVTLAVQDDTGYIKLLHRFTGAAVALRVGRRVVPGSDRMPAHPRRRATLEATAFPRGPLAVAVAMG